MLLYVNLVCDDFFLSARTTNAPVSPEFFYRRVLIFYPTPNYHYFSMTNMWYLYILNKWDKCIIPHFHIFRRYQKANTHIRHIKFGTPQKLSIHKKSENLTNTYTPTHKRKIIDNESCLFIYVIFSFSISVLLLLSWYNTCKFHLVVHIAV